MDVNPELHVLGISFRTASEEVREGLAFSPSQARELLDRARGQIPGVEAVVLSTCNRTEFYLSAPADSDVVTSWDRLLRTTRPGAPARDRACQHYEHRGAEAFRHLLRVACGLDSALLGDGQVLGQVRRSLALSQEAGVLGGVLSPAFAAALTTGRQARTQTDIGKGAPGVGAAVAEALRTRRAPREAGVLVLGSGEGARTITRALVKSGFVHLSVTARNAQAATRVAAQVGALEVPWADRRAAIAGAEVVVVATAAPSPMLATPSPGGITRLVVDAGFPRQVSPSAGGVELVSLLALTQAADSAAAARLAAVPAVEALIARRVEGWQRDQDRTPLEEAIKRLHLEVDAMAAATAAELAQRTGAATADLQPLIARQVRKVLHGHVSELRKLSAARP